MTQNIIRNYTEQEKFELKLNILKALQKDCYLTKTDLQKQFHVGKWIIESILAQCIEEKLLIPINNKRKIVARRGLEYLENNY